MTKNEVLHYCQDEDLKDWTSILFAELTELSDYYESKCGIVSPSDHEQMYGSVRRKVKEFKWHIQRRMAEIIENKQKLKEMWAKLGDVNSDN